MTLEIILLRIAALEISIEYCSTVEAKNIQTRIDALRISAEALQQEAA